MGLYICLKLQPFKIRKYKKLHPFADVNFPHRQSFSKMEINKYNNIIGQIIKDINENYNKIIIISEFYMERDISAKESPFKAHDDQDSSQQNDSYNLNVIHNLNSQSSQYSEPPILSYSYSGVSNASSNPQLTLHSSRIYEQPSHFTFIKAQKLYNSIQKMVSQAKQALLLEEDIILYILQLNKWSKDRLYENYYNEADLYVNKNNMLKQQRENVQQIKQICSICEEKKSLLKNLLCHHRYCFACWRHYIKQKLNESNVFFPCMNKCSNSPILLHSFVERFFYEMFELYRKMVCINYAVTNKSISYCPSKKNNCDLFCERTEALFDASVQCRCGELYCFFCREEPHYPATCDDVIKWKKLLNSQEGNQTWIQKNTKACPSCKAAVEKYIGCSKIKCMCGAQFCYDCNAKWDEKHKSNKGQCTQLKRKQSLEERAGTSDFLKTLEWSLAISRTEKKNMETISIILEFLREQWILSKIHGIKKQVSDAWLALKWGTIASFIYKRNPVDPFIQQQFIQSIAKLMESVEKINNVSNLMFPKDILTIGDQVLSRRQILKKNKDVWLEAWRGN